MTTTRIRLLFFQTVLGVYAAAAGAGAARLAGWFGGNAGLAVEGIVLLLAIAMALLGLENIDPRKKPARRMELSWTASQITYFTAWMLVAHGFVAVTAALGWVIAATLALGGHTLFVCEFMRALLRKPMSNPVSDTV